MDQPSPHDVPLIDRTSGKVNRRSVVSRSGHRVELLDARAPGPSGLRLMTADERLEVRLDDRRDRIELTVYAGRGRPLTSVVLDKDGITLDAKLGKVNVRGRQVDIDGTDGVRIGGRSVQVNGTTDVTVDGGLLGVLKARLIRIN